VYGPGLDRSGFIDLKIEDIDSKGMVVGIKKPKGIRVGLPYYRKMLC